MQYARAWPPSGSDAIALSSLQQFVFSQLSHGVSTEKCSQAEHTPQARSVELQS